MEQSESRTKKSFRNSSVALIFYFIALFLEFFSRKVFLNGLGEDVLGLNSTATSILQFLNIAELGIGSAIAFSLYKPLFENDENSINEIISLQGHFYRKVATFVIIGAIIVMTFFPIIFKKITLPLWYAYASFGVLLFSALLSYFYNYKQAILSASQQNYKIQYSYKLPMLIKVGCQMAAIYWLNNGYIWWLILEVIFAVIASISLSHTVRTSFPKLVTVKITKEIKKKYSIVYLKIKQLIYGKIASFALSQTSPLIIYAYIDLAVVALYCNYMIIVNGLTALIRAVFNDIVGGIGNLVASSTLLQILKVFKELFCVRMMISCVFTFAAIELTTPFICVWIGKEYLLSTTTLYLICGILYIQLSRNIVESFLSAYGLFSDIFAPIIEAVLNIGLSILFGYYYGLNGILCGVLISLILVVGCWKPYFLYSRGFKVSVLKYIKLFLKNGIIIISTAIATIILFHYLMPQLLSYWECLFYRIIEVIFYIIFLNLSLYFSKCGIELFYKRLLSLKKRPF